MSNDLVVFQRQLEPLVPNFAEALGPIMPVDRFARTAIICVERLPSLLECNRQTLFNAIMTFAVLGLEIDGVTGQGFILPFKQKAQPVIGYRGMNTLGARAGLTITGDVVREDDDFDYELGTSAHIRHRPKLGNTKQIIAAWATATANDRPPIVCVMGIDELMAVKAKSPGARKQDSPWNDTAIGFPAMCAKTAKRRLSRSTPLSSASPQMMMAARMDEAFEEQGKHAFIVPGKGLVIEGEEEGGASRVIDFTPTAEEIVTPVKTDTGPRDPLSRIKADGLKAAGRGMAELERWWNELHPADKKPLKSYLDETLKPVASQSETERTPQ